MTEDTFWNKRRGKEVVRNWLPANNSKILDNNNTALKSILTGLTNKRSFLVFVISCGVVVTFVTLFWTCCAAWKITSHSHYNYKSCRVIDMSKSLLFLKTVICILSGSQLLLFRTRRSRAHDFGVRKFRIHERWYHEMEFLIGQQQQTPNMVKCWSEVKIQWISKNVKMERILYEDS